MKIKKLICVVLAVLLFGVHCEHFPSKIVSAVSYSTMTDDNGLVWKYRNVSVEDGRGNYISAVILHSVSADPDITEITVPDMIGNRQVAGFFINFFDGFSSLEKINATDDSAVFKSVDGVLYNKDMTVIYKVPKCFKSENNVFEVPESVTALMCGAFSENETIEEIILGDNITDLKKSIDGYQYVAFSSCSALKKIKLPDTLTVIPTDFMANCNSLEEIVFPSSLEQIEYNSFVRCDSLRKVVLPEGLKKLDGSAFAECNSLEEVVLPSSLETMESSFGNALFRKCNGLEKIEVSPENMHFCTRDGVLYNKEMDEIIFYPSGKDEMIIDIPETVVSLGEYAFCGDFSGKEIIVRNAELNFNNSYISNNITLCGYSGSTAESFAKTKGISFKNIETSEMMPYYLRYEIQNERVHITSCVKNVSEIIIPAELEGYPVTEIDEDFLTKDIEFLGEGGYRAGRKKVTFEDGIKSVSMMFFNYCYDLKEVVIPASVEVIDWHKINLSLNQRRMKITVDPANTVFSDVNGVLFSKDGTELIRYSNDPEISVYTVPDSVDTISAYAFAHCTSLEEVIIPDSVTEIPGCAFSACSSLKRINIPEHVTSLGTSAFAGCTSLESITLPESLKELCAWSFFDCTSLTEIRIPAAVSYLGNFSAGYSTNDLGRIDLMPEFRMKVTTGSAAEKYALQNKVAYTSEKSENGQGDLNNDGKTDSADLLILKLILTGVKVPDEIQKKEADMNSDGVINIFDQIRLVSSLLG